MEIKIKKLEDNAVIPKYSHESDACFDLTATSISTLSGKYIEYGTGLAFDIPVGYVGLIFPRSSISEKNLFLTNHVGVIDSGYQGEVRFRFKRDNSKELFEDIYKVGDRIGQMMIIPRPEIELKVVENFGVSSRGTDGFGSTGN